MSLKIVAVPTEIKKAMMEANASKGGYPRRKGIGLLMLGIVVGMLCALSLCLAGVITWETRIAPALRAKEITRYVNVTGIEVNERVLVMIAQGQGEKVYSFYDQFIGQREQTLLVVMNALTNEIPMHTFVSLGREEGQFSPQARNINYSAEGKMLSVDIGGYQLNSLTFRGYSIAELARPETNVRLAAEKLAADHRSLADWTKTLIWYNANKLDGLKQRTVLHVIKILNGERVLDEAFVAQVLK
ncbi:MAG: transglycosylase SLT domain-containing protein [Chloroflexi bacterium]|nr:transglycosylase SLT domain-containing protein [Chloroflexota bacterium]